MGSRAGATPVARPFRVGGRDAVPRCILCGVEGLSRADLIRAAAERRPDRGWAYDSPAEASSPGLLIAVDGFGDREETPGPLVTSLKLVGYSDLGACLGCRIRQ